MRKGRSTLVTNTPPCTTGVAGTPLPRGDNPRPRNLAPVCPPRGCAHLLLGRCSRSGKTFSSLGEKTEMLKWQLQDVRSPPLLPITDQNRGTPRCYHGPGRIPKPCSFSHIQAPSVSGSSTQPGKRRDTGGCPRCCSRCHDRPREQVSHRHRWRRRAATAGWRGGT